MEKSVSITSPTGEQIQVIKRDGTKELSNTDKIDKVLKHAINGYKKVSLPAIKEKAHIRLHDNIHTSEIQKLLVKSASDLISPQKPEYQYVAAKLLVYDARKHVWGSKYPPLLYNFIKENVYDPDTSEGIYDETILEDYTKEEIDEIGCYIQHQRDFLFTYAGMQQMVDKYLISKGEKENKVVKETPQLAYMLIAMNLFRKYDEPVRTEYVKKCYDYISTFKINLPTPIMAGVRTKLFQFSSCVLIDVDDSIDGIGAAAKSAMRYVADRAGLGINFGRIRARNMRAGASRQMQVRTTGVVPFLKIFESVVKSTSQNGLRIGSATINFPFWHSEILSVLNLKNNTGTDDNRVRNLDYVIQFCGLFYERFVNGDHVTLFSPHEVPELYNAFGLPEFDDIYRQCERKEGISKIEIPAKDLMERFLKERLETGRYYVMNIDHCNQHGSFKDRVTMTNLCAEITHPTKPMKDIEDEDAEIGVCILSAINLGYIESDYEIEEASDIIVRLLDEVIDIQDYPIAAAERFTRNRRSLGVGVTNVAYFLAKNGVKYEDKEAWQLIDEKAEKIQYFLLKASNQLASEKGKCNKFSSTKYSDGILPIDTYKKFTDKIIQREASMDWEKLRKDILNDGLRHSTLTAVMPVESSSVIQNSTNGIEPPRTLLTVKKSKTGALRLLAPDCNKIGDKYTLAYEMDNNRGYLNIVAAIQRWFDMAISANLYYDYMKERYTDKKIPLSELAKDLLYAYKMGVKTLYYSNTNDGNGEDDDDGGCAGGMCKL